MDIEGKTPEKESRLVNINTKKYQAVPVRNTSEKGLFMVTTARKSRIRAQNVCPTCGLRVRRPDLRRCQLCGSEMCVNCLWEFNEEYFCSGCKEEMEAGGQ